MPADPTLRAMLIASLRASRLQGLRTLTGASLAGAVLENTKTTADAIAVAELALEYLRRVEREERADTLPPMPAAAPVMPRRSTYDPRGPCQGGCGRKAIDGKATCGEASCSTLWRQRGAP